jgi:hypothetical protein
MFPSLSWNQVAAAAIFFCCLRRKLLVTASNNQSRVRSLKNLDIRSEGNAKAPTA